MAANDSTTLKRCSKKENCIHPLQQDGGWLPATKEYFPAGKSFKDGLYPQCKACHNATNRQYYTRNTDKVNLKNRRWAQAHSEQMREIQRRYDQRNPPRIRMQRWRIQNPERNREIDRRYRIEHPEQRRQIQRRYDITHSSKRRTKERNYRARKLAAEGTHTAADIEVQFERQSGFCFYCHCKLTNIPNQPNSRTVDHVVPLKRGGRNSPDNLVIACSTCNSSKGSKLPHEWLKGGRLL